MEMSFKRRKSLNAAIQKLKVSKPVKQILFQITVEIEESWAEQIDALKKENKALKKKIRDIHRYNPVLE